MNEYNKSYKMNDTYKVQTSFAVGSSDAWRAVASTRCVKVFTSAAILTESRAVVTKVSVANVLYAGQIAFVAGASKA